jgi:hypothetical protein
MDCDNLRGHKLLTKELQAKIPMLYETDNAGLEPMAFVRLFSPYMGWEWYVLEFDGEDTLFGFVFGDFNEYGYFSLNELTNAVAHKIVPAVERDLSFETTPLSEILKMKDVKGVWK